MLTVEITLAPTLIIGIYLPTTNTPTDIYQDYLSNMEKLVNSHPHGPIIIAGDYNAHVGPVGGPRYQERQDCQGKLLAELVDRNDLFFISLSGCTKGPHYTFFRDGVSSTTDYSSK